MTDHKRLLDSVGPNGVPARFDGNVEAAKAEYERIRDMSDQDVLAEFRKVAAEKMQRGKP